MIQMMLVGADSYSPGSFTNNGPSGSYTFVVPAGVTSLTVECWGGGSGGNIINGGCGGGYAKGVFTVTPYQSISYFVGYGSSVNTTQSNGWFVGGASWFSSSAELNASGGGGAGGTGSGTALIVGYTGGSFGSGFSGSGIDYGGGGGGGAGSGGNGSNGTNATSSGSGAGGSGGTPDGGAGGTGAYANSNTSTFINATAATAPGAGGGGGGNARGGVVATVGADGRVKITW